MAPTPVNMDATHFCARPNGHITSMICADDLPKGMSIDGAPRKLSPAETQGMTSCGVMPNRSEPWIIKQDNKLLVHAGHKGLVEQLKSSLYALMEDDSVPSCHRDTIGKLMGELADEPIPSNALVKISPTLTNSSQSSQNRRARHGYGRKEYCSYWIRHGECDYQQQGCLFKHEMPLEPDMLESLGLRDIPRWYRDKHGLRSLLSTPDYPQPPRSGRLAITDRPRYKAIAYPENCTDSTVDISAAAASNSFPQVFSGPTRSARNNGNGKKGRGNGGNGFHKGNGSRANGNQNQKSGEAIRDGSSAVIMPESPGSGALVYKSGGRQGAKNRNWRKKANGESPEVPTSAVVNSDANSVALVKKSSPLTNEVSLGETNDTNEQTTSHSLISLTPPLSTQPSSVSSIPIFDSSPVMRVPVPDSNRKAAAESFKTEDSAGAEVKVDLDIVTVTKDDDNTEAKATPTVSMPGSVPTGPKADRIPAGPKADRPPLTATPFSPARSVRGRSFASPSGLNEGSSPALGSIGTGPSHKANPSGSSRRGTSRRRSRRHGNNSTSSVATVRPPQQAGSSQKASPSQYLSPVQNASSAQPMTSAQHVTSAQQINSPQQASNPTSGHVGQNMPASTSDFHLAPHPWHPNVRQVQGARGPITVVDNFPSFGGVKPIPFDYSDPSCPAIQVTEASPVQSAGQGLSGQGRAGQGPAGQGFSRQDLAGQGFASQGYAQGNPNWRMPPPGLPVPPEYGGAVTGGFLNPATPSFAPIQSNQTSNLALTRRSEHPVRDYDPFAVYDPFTGLPRHWEQPGVHPSGHGNDKGNMGADGGFSVDVSNHWLSNDIRGILRGMAPDDKAGNASAQQWANETFGEVTPENVNDLLDSSEDENPIPDRWVRWPTSAFYPGTDRSGQEASRNHRS
ncbi:Zinc finger CCCH-type [Penicillium herquei]|nr:Zinc finger CCCH-type [Penicillium herquei]